MTSRAPRVRVTTPASATAVRRTTEAHAYASRRLAESLEALGVFLAEQAERRREREQERARFLARRRLGAHLHFEAPDSPSRSAS